VTSVVDKTPAPRSAGLAAVSETLPNGVHVIVKQTSRTPAVTLNLAMTSGAVCDPQGLSGAMYLLGRLIDRGTHGRSGHAIAEELDHRGISLNVNVSRHQMFLICTALAADFEPVFEVLADVVRHPIVPDTELAIRMGEVVTSIRQDEDSPLVRAADGLAALLYGSDHPYGRRIRGEVETIQRVRRDDLVALHAGTFAPSGLTVVVVGDVDCERVFQMAARVLGDWEARAPASAPLPTPRPSVTRTQRIVSMPGKAQADVAYGFVGIARSDPNYYAHFLMNNVLGQYGMGGRLGDSIRERQGMAYYVSSVLDANVLPGSLSIRAGVAPENVDRTIASIDEELTKLLADGLSAEELQASRQYLIGSVPRALETNSGIANFLQTAAFFRLGLDFDTRLPDLLRAVTLDEVNRAARDVVDPARAAVVVAGPPATP
jgi:zinc protease